MLINQKLNFLLAILMETAKPKAEAAICNAATVSETPETQIFDEDEARMFNVSMM